MHIVSYKQLTPQQKQKFVEFLKRAGSETTQPAYENMWSDNWEDKNNTILYLLEKTGRFSDGGVYNILFDGEEVVASSGIYTSSFCNELAIAGTRTWIDKKYRNLSIAREYLLPAEKEWAIKNNFKAIAICFNDYNKNMTKIWKRIRLGENRTPRRPHHIFYNGVNEVEYPVIIQYTNQWIMYEKLDQSFEFDWSSIKAN